MTERQRILVNAINKQKEEKRIWFEIRLEIKNGTYKYNCSLKKCTQRINECDRLINKFREYLKNEVNA